MKGIDTIIKLCYGHPHQSTKEEIETAILLLRQEGQVNRKELADALGYDLQDESDRRVFDEHISPMKGNNSLGIKILTTYKREGETYYSLSREAFDASKEPMLKRVRDTLKEKENQRIHDLEQKLHDIQAREERDYE